MRIAQIGIATAAEYGLLYAVLPAAYERVGIGDGPLFGVGHAPDLHLGKIAVWIIVVVGYSALITRSPSGRRTLAWCLSLLTCGSLIFRELSVPILRVGGDVPLGWLIRWNWASNNPYAVVACCVAQTLLLGAVLRAGSRSQVGGTL